MPRDVCQAQKNLSFLVAKIVLYARENTGVALKDKALLMLFLGPDLQLLLIL
jgi:hypothetical protein